MKPNAMIILLFSVLLLQNSCAQNTMSTNYRDKIKNNYKNVKMFDYNPTYQIRFENYVCYLEFYINDVLVVYLGGKGKSAGDPSSFRLRRVPTYF